MKLKIRENDSDMKYGDSNYKYSAYFDNGDIEESDSKTKLINLCRKSKDPAYVVDNTCHGIIFNNRAQIKKDNS